jgi:hypothetical protein
VFVDEAGFKLTMTRGRGRSRRGSKAIQIVRKGEKYFARFARENLSFVIHVCVSTGEAKNITLIAAISPTRGLIYHEIHVEGTDGDRFTTFIHNLLRTPVMNERKIRRKKNRLASLAVHSHSMLLVFVRRKQSHYHG